MSDCATCGPEKPVADVLRAWTCPECGGRRAPDALLGHWNASGPPGSEVGQCLATKMVMELCSLDDGSSAMSSPELLVGLLSAAGWHEAGLRVGDIEHDGLRVRAVEYGWLHVPVVMRAVAKRAGDRARVLKRMVKALNAKRPVIFLARAWMHEVAWLWPDRHVLWCGKVFHEFMPEDIRGRLQDAYPGVFDP